MSCHYPIRATRSVICASSMGSSGVDSLLGVSAVMLFGSYAAGFLPAVVKLSNPRHLQLVREWWTTGDG